VAQRPRNSSLFLSINTCPSSRPIHPSSDKVAMPEGKERLEMLPELERKEEVHMHSFLNAKVPLDPVLSFILEPEAQG